MVSGSYVQKAREYQGFSEMLVKGNRSVWASTTNRCCSTDWSKKWSGNTTQLRITGVTTGVTEIIFRLGNSNKADEQESFRVLVIVT